MSAGKTQGEAPQPPRQRRSWLKKILLGLVLIVLVLVVAILLQPTEFRVVRSATMSAPPSEVFPQVNDFHNWDAWSPWAKLDPEMKVTYDGPAAGEGAAYAWVGNDEVGEGRMTVIQSKPNELVGIKLDAEGCLLPAEPPPATSRVG